MEMLLGDTFSPDALEVGETVDPQHSSVIDRLMSLEIEEGLSSLYQLPLQLDDSRDVLVMVSQVVQQSNCLLALHTGLYSLVSNVKGVLGKPRKNTYRVSERMKEKNKVPDDLRIQHFIRSSQKTI